MLTAQATDHEDGAATSAAAHITVTSVANTAPTVRLVAPVDGQVFVVGSAVALAFPDLQLTQPVPAGNTPAFYRLRRP